MKRKVSQYIYFISFLILGSLAYSSSANIAQTIHASTYILPEPDSFLDSFNGSDINGIEDVVKKINRCDERWRKDAESRIDKNRKHNFHLQFIKSDGQPYSNEKVRVKLVKHAFKFGVALKYPYFSEPNLLEDHISERVLSHDWAFDIDQRFKLINQFSTEVGFANAFKYKLSWLIDSDHLQDTILPRLRSMGLSIRGHNLIWPGWKHMHEDAISIKEDPEALRLFCENQIKDYVSKWDVDEWDVINEPRVNQDVQKVIGKECMADWFKLARKYEKNPNTGLYLNDYKVISKDNKPWNKDNIEAYETTVEYLLGQEAPITHLGFQNRYHEPVDPQVIYDRLENFKKYSLPMKATEFEIRDSADYVFSELERAQMTADIMTTWFSHSLVNGIMAWTFFDIEGSIDKKTNEPRCFSLLYENKIKLNGKIWLYLIHKHWNTDIVKETNKKGVLSGSGFFGDYEVLLRDGDEIKRALIKLDRDSYVYKIQL